ncbi:MAG: hypothetical protein IT365_00395 [Candidatus Hydrogenedentes bacterium]|nr:hypothetical protein [Candidatus Hydrogenedentota bacterium]
MATKYHREDIRGRTGKTSQPLGDMAGATAKRLGGRPGMVRILALLSIISVLAVVDGAHRRNRLQQEGPDSAMGEVVEKRGPSTDKPESGHELLLRLVFPEDESVVVSTEVDPDLWASLKPGDGVRVHYAPGPEVGTLEILAIEPGAKQVPAEGTPPDSPPPSPAD